MNEKQLLHYQAKLAYKTDSWDVYVALEAAEQWGVVDGRSLEAYKRDGMNCLPTCVGLGIDVFRVDRWQGE